MMQNLNHGEAVGRPPPDQKVVLRFFLGYRNSDLPQICCPAMLRRLNEFVSFKVFMRLLQSRTRRGLCPKPALPPRLLKPLFHEISWAESDGINTLNFVAFD